MTERLGWAAEHSTIVSSTIDLTIPSAVRVVAAFLLPPKAPIQNLC